MAAFNLSLASVKAYSGYSDDDESRDVQLQILLDAAIDMLRQLTGRKLTRGEYLDTLEYFPDRVYLREFPIESVSAVSVGGTPLPTTEYRVFLDSGCVQFYYSQRYLYGTRWLSPGTGSFLTIQYVAGYKTLPGNMLMALYSGIHAADLAQKQAILYGGVAKAITVQDVGAVELHTFRDPTFAILKDVMAAQLGTQTNDSQSLGAPLLHESERLGDAP